jgi:protein phosphatase
LFEFYQSYDSDPTGRLLSAIQAANTDIFTYAQTHSSRPMGTTLVAASVCQDRLVVANVGDSRAYLIRSQQIEQLTHDHSLVQKLVDEHQLTAEEARTSKQRNIILRSVGSNERVAVDTFRVELKEDDLVLLCSDGLHKYFADPQELAEAALDGPVELAAQRLIDLANERGGSDNISVILVRIGPRNSIPDDSEEEHAHRSNAGEQIKHKQRRSGIKPAPLILGILLALALLISAFFLVRSVSPSLFEPTNPTVPNSFDAGSMLPV